MPFLHAIFCSVWLVFPVLYDTEKMDLLLNLELLVNLLVTNYTVSWLSD